METFSLKCCFVFSPSLNPSTDKPTDQDIQDAKLLLYYPQNVDKSIQRSNIGIVEGTLSFLRTFDSNEDNQMLITELNSSYLIAKLFEEKFYLVLQLEKQIVGLSQFNSMFNRNHWLKCLIDNVYDFFYLFHGDFSRNFFPNNKDIRENTLAYNNLIVKFSDFIVCYFEYFANITTPFFDKVLFTNNSPYILNLIFSTLRLNEKMNQVDRVAIAFKGRIIYNEIDISTLALLYNLFFSIESQEKFYKFRTPPFKEINRLQNENDPDHYSYTQVDDESTKECFSPFLKAFEIPKGEDKGYLMGLMELEKELKYHVFVPMIHIRNLNQQYQLMVYYYKEMCFFLLMAKEFNNEDVESLKQIANNILNFYGSAMQKLSVSHQHFILNASMTTFQYLYCNNDNHELHFSALSNIWKNDKEKSKIIQNIYEMIHPAPPSIHESSITKLRDNYVYYISFLEKRYVLILKELVPIELIKRKYSAEIDDKISYV